MKIKKKVMNDIEQNFFMELELFIACVQLLGVSKAVTEGFTKKIFAKFLKDNFLKLKTGGKKDAKIRKNK